MRTFDNDDGPLVSWLLRHSRTLDFTIFGVAIVTMAIFGAQLVRVSL